MEDLKKKMSADMNDKEIVFSKSIKAGKRIYYLDVKKNRKDEMFLAITESKKVITGEGDDSLVSFEKLPLGRTLDQLDRRPLLFRAPTLLPMTPQTE